MPLFKILNRFTGEIIFEGEFKSLKLCVKAAIRVSTDLRHADLNHADLSYANLSYADLRHANLSYADLSYANLSYADLNHADLRHADLYHADLNNANLNHADIWVSIFRSFSVSATTHGLRIGCEYRTWKEWKSLATKPQGNKYDDPDFIGFFKVCLAAKKWLDDQFGKEN